MPVLEKVRYERFATEIATGSTYSDAYVKAGYRAKQSVARKNASRLATNADIQARISEIKAEITAKSIMSGMEVLQELTKIGRSDMRHYMKVGPDGQPVLDWSDLSPEQTAVIQEVTVEEFTDGRSDKREVRRVKFKLVPKIPALELLGKHHGLLTERIEVKQTVTILHALLKEIDAESREIVTIEHEASGESEPDVL